MAAAVAAAFLAVAVPPALAQPRTDVVTLANRDRITGEIVRLDRGRLQFKTDDAGTLYLEWDKLTSVVSTRPFEVATTDGRTFEGSLAQTTDRSIAISGLTGTVTLPMADVTMIATIGLSFWRKLDGSLDVGFSYTRSSGVEQLNVNSDTIYHQPGSQARVTASITQTETSDDSDQDDDDRGAISLSYLRYPWRKWFIAGVGRFESNRSLGLELRSQVGGAAGPRLVNSNRAQLGVGAGVVVNDERGVDVESTRNVEALLMFRSSYYTYDQPRTNLDLSFFYYASITDTGRQRFQLDVGAKREFWKDFFLALTLYDTFDSRPPNPDADRNDVGITFSIGWTY